MIISKLIRTKCFAKKKNSFDALSKILASCEERQWILCTWGWFCFVSFDIWSLHIVGSGLTNSCSIPPLF